MSLLTTKLFVPPPRPNQVARPRLIGRLEEGLRLGHRLIVLSAPAGSGKTTLLSHWIHQQDVDAGWLSLDAEDSEPTRFWRYVIAALQTLRQDLGQEALQAFGTAQPFAAQALVTSLLNDVAALAQSGSATPLVLVLDDYQHITTPAVHEALGFLLEHQPPNLYLVIATRADPPLPLFRLRARGQLTELRSADLRFTPGEASTFLNATMNLGLGPEEIQALEARTEGWIVGLQLAALALLSGSCLLGQAESADLSAFIGSHRYVLEYLTEEVVRSLAEPVQHFLLWTSVLERLCGPLCDAVTGNVDGAAMLANLEGQNLFIVPLDAEQRWYRYHHLFGDLLSNLLRNELAPEEIRALHARASEWHERHGRPDGAIHHALQAHGFARAASLIEAEAQTMVAQGRLNTLSGWLEALPQDLLEERPQLLLYRGWALSLSGQPERAEQVLREAKATLYGLPASDEVHLLRGQLAVLLAGLATLREHPATVIREATEALDCLPETDLVSRGRVYVALGTAYAYEDRPQEATQTWQQARDLALEAGNPFLATAAIEMLAGTQIYHQGRLGAAAADLQRVLDLGAMKGGRHLPFTGTAHALLGEIHLERDDLDAAAAYLDKGIELLGQGGIGYGRVHTFCASARLARAREDAEGALEALQVAEQALAGHALWHMILHLAAYEVQLRLWLGDLEGAARWAEGDPTVIKRAMPETLPLYLGEVQQISRARLHLARQEPELALVALTGLGEQALGAGRMAQAIQIDLLRALAWQAQGESNAALTSLEQALAWAEPEGYVRLFLEAGPGVIPLLRKAASRDLRPRYAGRLLAAFGVDQRHAVSPVQAIEAQPLPEPLTPRELEVLRLICEGLSNRDIAEQLTVTLNTVKKHSSHIYGKLGVRSRAQAIVQAQQLGLC